MSTRCSATTTDGPRLCVIQRFNQHATHSIFLAETSHEDSDEASGARLSCSAALAPHDRRGRRQLLRRRESEPGRPSSGHATEDIRRPRRPRFLQAQQRGLKRRPDRGRTSSQIRDQVRHASPKTVWWSTRWRRLPRVTSPSYRDPGKRSAPPTIAEGLRRVAPRPTTRNEFADEYRSQANSGASPRCRRRVVAQAGRRTRSRCSTPTSVRTRTPSARSTSSTPPTPTTAYGRLAPRVMHPVVRNYLEKFGYYDIFLVDRRRAATSCTRFSRNSTTRHVAQERPLRRHELRRGVPARRTSSDQGRVRARRLRAVHARRTRRPRASSPSPVFRRRSKGWACSIFQMPVDRINRSHEPPAKAWATRARRCLSAPTCLMRCDSFLKPETHSLSTPRSVNPDEPGRSTSRGRSAAALDGETGVAVVDRLPRRSKRSPRSGPVNLLGTRWAIDREDGHGGGVCRCSRRSKRRRRHRSRASLMWTQPRGVISIATIAVLGVAIGSSPVALDQAGLARSTWSTRTSGRSPKAKPT